MTSATCCWCSAIASKEIPSAASVQHMSSPLSSLGMKPFGTNQNSSAGPNQREERDAHHGRAVPERPGQRAVVEPRPWRRRRLRRPRRAAVVRLRRRAQEPAAEHRRERQRDEAGDQDRHADGHGELVEQPPDDAAHEQHRDEHRRQRERHRDDGEADLARAVQRRLEDALAHLHVPDDVLEHDDGVVHHEADREVSAISERLSRL